MTSFLFVGERQSPRAAAVGATWQNRRMAARTLCAALLALGIDPDAQEFVNLWDEPGLGKPSFPPNPETLIYLRKCGAVIIGMGKIVQCELDKAGIPYRAMVHPAARGAIRRSELYISHVRAVLDVQIESAGATDKDQT